MLAGSAAGWLAHRLSSLAVFGLFRGWWRHVGMSDLVNLIKVLGDGLAIGPVLLGAARPAHIVTPSITVRGIVNMTAVAVVEAQSGVA